ncbi:hypothetical protein HMPREF1624_02032 [Sporothrix schenckii ATCC 58251]|uniref:Xylanolytic transcriptional activator regulatory domain-containing protein n=1 Tax=Sporothrix schenckii (strain ATCC 58251 / de Perez 2211183) TaxID=1391915 RepID=U7PYS0_SPOS1|nr:hypothetical protein HMPREF1624_02032 [Sporothrix schenckii ATCC 58251]
MSSSRPSTDDAYDGSAASSSASPPKRRHIEAPSSVSTGTHSLRQHQNRQHHRLDYHSNNNRTGNTIPPASSMTQTNVEVEAKARLKLKTVPHPSSASRSWGGGRKQKVAIELETSFLQNHGLLGPVQESRRPSADGGLEEHTRASSSSGHEEEAILLQTTRMLQDQKGRLLYIGDSATLSFLHLFRLMVESISGQSNFTLDPRKESIVENVVSLPPYVRPPCMLPDRHTADLLVESFFVNTGAIIEVFDRREFLAELERCYANPLIASTPFLCLLFLAFSIGLAMAASNADTVDASALRQLVELPYDQAELFFRTAKVMDDPLNGVEDAELWSVQAQLLMAVYMLAVSKRNAAFTYHGIAVRSAIALGLHREETMVNFSTSEVLLRCNIWRSLYVLDRFIAASLGRPPAISDNDCTDVAFKDAMMLPHIAPIGPMQQPSTMGQGTMSAGGPGPAPPSSSSSSSNHAVMTGRCSKPMNNFGFDASVRSCRIIGIILKKMYVRRRVSSRATADIVRQCSVWAKEMTENLRWQRTVEAAAALDAGKIMRMPQAESIAILRTNLFYCHAVILLTRPFFLFLIQADRRNHASPGSLGNFFGALNKSGSHSSIGRINGTSRPAGYGSSGRFSPPLRTRTERFAENCVTASYHTIAMVGQALTTKYLPQRDPFIMHFLFTATLLIMANEFIAMFHNTTYDEHIDLALRVMTFFSTSDPQAQRLAWILDALREAVDKHAAKPNTADTSNNDSTNSDQKKHARDKNRTFRFEFPRDFIPGTTDPIDTFFVLQPAHAAAGGGAVPFRGGQGGRTLQVPSSQLAQPPAEAGTGAGSSQLMAPSADYIHVDTGFAGQSQGSIEQHQQPGLLDLQNVGMPTSMSATSAGSAQQRGVLYGGESNEGASTANPLLLPPPFAMPAAVPPSDFSPQYHTQPQHQHSTSTQHPQQPQHQQQHSVNIAGGTGGGGLGPDAFQSKDSKAANGDLDGTDSIETDGEGFDFDILWNWSNPVGQVAADGTTDATVGMTSVGLNLTELGSGAVPSTMNFVRTAQQQGDGTVLSAYGDTTRGRDGEEPVQGGSDIDMNHAPAATQNAPMPLPPMYSPYGIAPLSSTVGSAGLGMSGVHGHGNLAASLNVPLYTTTDFG